MPKMSALEKALHAEFDATQSYATTLSEPPRSASPYSMIEADITDPMHTPPSTDDRYGERGNKKTFIDDSIDSASFCGSGFGSHAGSHKTHSSYIRSQNNSTTCKFDPENGDSGSDQGWNTKPHLFKNLFDSKRTTSVRSGPVGSYPKMNYQSEYTGSSLNGTSPCCWDCYNGWPPSQFCKQAISPSHTSGSLAQHKIYGERSQWDETAWGAGKMGDVYSIGSSPRRRKYQEAWRTAVDADRDALLERVADLEDRFNMQQADVEFYKHMGETSDKPRAGCEDRKSALTPRGLDLLRNCAAGFGMSQAERGKAFHILDALQLEKAPSLTSIAPAHKDVPKESSVDGGTSTIETQVKDMSRDIIKLKAYEKFSRMQKDSDRLARIEAMLAGCHGQEFGQPAPLVDSGAKGLDDIRARLAELEYLTQHDTTNKALESHIEGLIEEVRELRLCVSNVQCTQDDQCCWLRDEMSALERRFDQMHVPVGKDKFQHKNYPGTLHSSAGLGGQDRKAKAGWKSTSSSSAIHGGHLRKDVPAYVYEHTFPRTGNHAWASMSGKTSDISDSATGGWGYSPSDFGRGLDYARARRSTNWGSGHGSEPGLGGDASLIRNIKERNRANIERDWDGNLISEPKSHFHRASKGSLDGSKNTNFGGW